jgi:hypothetical protein
MHYHFRAKTMHNIEHPVYVRYVELLAALKNIRWYNMMSGAQSFANLTAEHPTRAGY